MLELFSIAPRDNFYYRDSWKSDNYKETITEKKPLINKQTLYIELSRDKKRQH